MGCADECMRLGKLEGDMIHVQREGYRGRGKELLRNFWRAVPVEMDGFIRRCILQVLLTIYLWVLPLTSAKCLL